MLFKVVFIFYTVLNVPSQDNHFFVVGSEHKMTHKDLSVFRCVLRVTKHGETSNREGQGGCLGHEIEHFLSAAAGQIPLCETVHT